MLDFVSCNNFHWQRYWLSLQHEVQTYHVPPVDSPHIFRPGEFAHAKGVIFEDFFNFLEERGYTLNEEERHLYMRGQRTKLSKGKTAKPCIILDRLGNGAYRIIHISSFGGNIKPEQIMSSMMRYFGFSMIKGEWPPGEKLLEVSPGMLKTSYAIMIPSVTKEVVPLDWKVRTFLKIGQLERLKRMMETRIQGFDDVADYIRAANLDQSNRRRTLLKRQNARMRGLFLDPPYTRSQLKVGIPYIETLHPGTHMIRLLHEGFRSGRKPVRVFKHDTPRLFVPQPNFVRHFHERTIDEMWIKSKIPVAQILREINPTRFRLPRMLR